MGSVPPAPHEDEAVALGGGQGPQPERGGVEGGEAADRTRLGAQSAVEVVGPGVVGAHQAPPGVAPLVGGDPGAAVAAGVHERPHDPVVAPDDHDRQPGADERHPVAGEREVGAQTGHHRAGPEQQLLLSRQVLGRRVLRRRRAPHVVGQVVGPPAAGPEEAPDELQVGVAPHGSARLPSGGPTSIPFRIGRTPSAKRRWLARATSKGMPP